MSCLLAFYFFSIPKFLGVKMAYSKEREAIWSEFMLRDREYYKTRAKLSLIKRGIKNPTPLQMEFEILLQRNKNLNKDDFLGDLSDHELVCTLLTAHGCEAKIIGQILKVKEDSVHKFRAQVTKKLNATNIPNSIFRATQAGILNLKNVDFLLFPDKKNLLVNSIPNAETILT